MTIHLALDDTSSPKISVKPLAHWAGDPHTLHKHRYKFFIKPGAPPLLSTRLLDQVRERIRYLHYSLKTEMAYLCWIRFLSAGARPSQAACGIRTTGRSPPSPLTPLTPQSLHTGCRLGACVHHFFNSTSTATLTIFPISRLALEVRYGEYDNFIFPNHIDNRKREFFGDTRRVPCLNGEPTKGNDAANAAAASTDCLNRSPRPTSIAS